MIYNCFPFYDEFMLLDIRLAELSEVVDKFVLVESPTSFSGKAKPLYFSDAMSRYRAWKDRIIPLVFQCSQPSADRWENEWAQRNALTDYLRQLCTDEDLILWTDADEIVSRKAVEKAASLTLPGRFLMKMYYYFLNCRQNEDWPWATFCRYGDFVRFFGGHLRNLRWSRELVAETIPDAGWHFSYIMDAERIAEKIGAFSYAEYDSPKWRNVEHIEACRRNHTDLFNRPELTYEIVALDELPDAIRKHPERYQEFLKANDGASRHPVLQESVSA